MRLIDADALNIRRYTRWFENEADARQVERMIREAPAITLPPNDPLTLEELREMDGEPVWLRGNGLNRWYIFDGFSLDGIPFFTPEIGWKPWTAYRHRPEEYTR